MSLANLLKKGSLRGFATATPATPATDKPNIPPSVASVATVAVASAQDNSANDAPDTWNVYIPPGTSAATVATFRATSLALDATQRAADVPQSQNPDGDCWPHSATALAHARAFVPIDPNRWAWPAFTSMTGVEIETFTARLAWFTDKGLDLDASERLADRLVTRDREYDERRHCLECLHLHRGGGWRCGNWARAGIAVRARDAQLSPDFVDQLQHCDGFVQQQ